MFDTMECPSSGVDLGTRGLETSAPLLDQEGLGGGLLNLQLGRVTELVGVPGTGLTRLGFNLLAPHSSVAPVVVLDVRGWISPEAAWESGVVAENLIIVRCNQTLIWPKVAAALLEGVRALYAEVPEGMRDHDLRRLAALARARKAAVAMRPLGRGLPTGVSYLRLRGIGVTWEGADRGHGKLSRRRLMLEASGKGAAGITRRFEVDDAGTDHVRVVSDVVVDQVGRAAG